MRKILFFLIFIINISPLFAKEVEEFSQGEKLLFFDDFNSLEDKNWLPLWAKEKEKVKLVYVKGGLNNSYCVLVKNNGNSYWSYSHKSLIKVEKGEMFKFSGWVKTKGESKGVLSVVLYGGDKRVIKWHFSKEEVVSRKWKKVEKEFVIPRNAKYIRFRLTGGGRGKVWFDNIKLEKIGKFSEKKILKEIKKYVIENDILVCEFNIEKEFLKVVDKRINKEWTSKSMFKYWILSRIEKIDSKNLVFDIIDCESLKKFRVFVSLDEVFPQITYKISLIGNKETLFNLLYFPPSFEITKKEKIVLPLQEGLLIPWDSIRDIPKRLKYYGGQLSMAFVGVIEDNGCGWMEVIETPFDFEVRIKKEGEKLIFENCWLGEKEYFGYERRISFVFFDKGGYVAMAKYYRKYAMKKGWFKTLKEKNSSRKGNIDKLIGAVDVWYWGIDIGKLAEDMKRLGIKKALMSNTDEWNIKKINKFGFLTSRYDIYQDVWPPVYHHITHLHEGWPEDLVLDKDGNWIKGWTIRKGLKEYPGGVVCSIRGLERAKIKIPQDLKRNPYTARFIDTTTCSPWRECYNPSHPTTRREDAKYKMELLKFCSEEMKLVTGSENGVDCAVPYCDYFEGMMSIGIGRLPNSGRNVSKVEYMPPTEKFLKYQVGVKYRIPLWELVYHDCVVSAWYWGDSSNRIPEVWREKDLFNILYGTMPLWAIRDWKYWKKYRSRFVKSYNNICPVFEKVGFKEMFSHKFVTDDKKVQETVFSGNIRIFVNFDEGKSYFIKEFNYDLPPKSFVVFENGRLWREGGYRNF